MKVQKSEPEGLHTVDDGNPVILDTKTPGSMAVWYILLGDVGFYVFSSSSTFGPNEGLFRRVLENM